MSRVLSIAELHRAKNIIKNQEAKQHKQPIFDELDTAWLKRMVHERSTIFSTNAGKMFDLKYSRNKMGEEVVRWSPVEGLTPVGGIEINLLKTMEKV